jgi:hypothetical protein
VRGVTPGPHSPSLRSARRSDHKCARRLWGSSRRGVVSCPSDSAGTRSRCRVFRSPGKCTYRTACCASSHLDMAQNSLIYRGFYGFHFFSKAKKVCSRILRFARRIVYRACGCSLTVSRWRQLVNAKHFAILGRIVPALIVGAWFIGGCQPVNVGAVCVFLALGMRGVICGKSGTSTPCQKPLVAFSVSTT